MPADFDWSDIGDWKAVWEQSPRDERGGGARGQRVRRATCRTAICARTGGCSARSGSSGLAVVDTADAVLVAPIERAQEVKGLVADLEAEGVAEARRRRGCTGPGAGTRPWTSATASG